MAAEGGWRMQKDYEGHKFSVKRFAYDVLYVTLSKCGFPETHLRVEVDEENDYPNPDDMLTVHAGVIIIALHSRDEWKRIFEYKQNDYGLNDMQKIKEFLLTIEVSLAFQLTDDLPDNMIRRSLAFYSELILFLHSNNIEVHFEKLLDIWNSYFNEKIAVKGNLDVLLKELFFEDSCIVGYLSLVDSFIEEFANPYGKTDDVSISFREFSELVEKFDAKPRIEELIQELHRRRLKSRPHNLLGPIPEAVEELASYFSGILEKDSALPGNRMSPEHPHGFLLPSSSARKENRLEQINLGNLGTTPESEGKTPNDKKPQ
ncbi:hypothetical protein AVEN_62697-1 [Araneus ventricosus]|uniref:Uncharacterized protein n=1 Tax=Araneus ventricosus TaxID=182803 RepID=A0A4Y2FLG3_ARAVE|nr:hypothetical protein AVEN_62697-1 [Araneus ventricosus]